jgi:hypothetical protein
VFAEPRAAGPSGRPPTGASRQLHARTASGVRAARATRNKLHARSVSLVVNPNFGLATAPELVSTGAKQEPQSDSEDELVDGARMARHHQPIVPNRLASLAAGHQPDSAAPTAGRSGPAADASPINEPTGQDQNARLREIGFFLRQISDEFSR